MKPAVVATTAASVDCLNINIEYQPLSTPKGVGMRAIFFGTPNAAIASLRALLGAGIEVPMICTRPARRAGRGRVLSPTSVEIFGIDSGIPVITPQALDAEAVATIRQVEADVYVVVAYGRFIPPELLLAPRLGVVNIHPSLLPRHRGPSPVATAILENDESTGVSIMLLDEEMDAGPILAQSEPESISSDVRCDALTERLFEMGAGMLPDVLRGYGAGKVIPRPQIEAEATVTRLLTKVDGEIDWEASADQIVRMNRAYHPWPGTSTFWGGEVFKIVDVEIGEGVNSESELDAGSVFWADDGSVCVAAGFGSSVRLVTVQASGRRAISAVEFANGRRDFIGSRLGAE